MSMTPVTFGPVQAQTYLRNKWATSNDSDVQANTCIIGLQSKMLRDEKTNLANLLSVLYFCSDSQHKYI